jgi:hypothetical protein
MFLPLAVCDVVCETPARETVSLAVPRESCKEKQEEIWTVAVIKATGKEAVWLQLVYILTSAGKCLNEVLTTRSS